MSGKRAAIILAAGQGTRMKSELPKVLHALAGRPMLDWGLALAQSLNCARTVVVTAANAEQVRERVRKAAGENSTAIQDPPLGTGHAARAAETALKDFDGEAVVFFADTPLIRTETLEAMFAARAAGAGVVMLGFHAADPTGYGRILRDSAGAFVKNVEHKDATEAERRETLCNAGPLVADAKVLFDLLSKLRKDNAQKEFYLTDVPGLALAAGMKVVIVEATETEVQGVNSRAQLAHAEAAFQERTRTALMDAGVTLIDPASVYFAFDTRIAADVIIEPHVFFGPGVSIAKNVRVKAFSHIEGAEIGDGAVIGPLARLRPGAKLGADVHIGNFVEVKNSVLGEGSKANHLTYIGDADVGAAVNFGAGSITCNFDGFDKFRTEIGDGAFIGSDTALVAPIRIGARAYTATGSVVTKDVPEGGFAVAREHQRNIDGWADAFRAKKKAIKDAQKKDEQ